MASGFFAILDDIAALMDDVAMSAKLATKKTAGILGDDLAVNAEKATGFLESRELPVLWAITKGSFINKLIILPVVFLLNFFLPAAITVILVLGGFFLAYEGVEKIVEFLFHKKHEEKTGEEVVAEQSPEDEKAKIKSAVVTDFILSLEIVIIALSSVLDKGLTEQILTVTVVAILATVGVYGIVALIVRMDDAGFKLIKRSRDKGPLLILGQFLVKALPVIIKVLAIVGTIALLMVSGGIFAHNIDFLHHILEDVTPIVREMLFGLAAGIVVVLLVTGVKKLWLAIKK